MAGEKHTPLRTDKAGAADAASWAERLGQLVGLGTKPDGERTLITRDKSASESNDKDKNKG